MAYSAILDAEKAGFFCIFTLCQIGIVDIGPLRFAGFLAWLTWLFVHILFLIGFRNRILVFLQYAWTYFTFQRGSRVILPAETIRRPDEGNKK